MAISWALTNMAVPNGEVLFSFPTGGIRKILWVRGDNSVTAESPIVLLHYLFMSARAQNGASVSKIFFCTPEWPRLAVLMATKRLLVGGSERGPQSESFTLPDHI